MIKIAICDDDALCLQNTKEAVSKWAFQYNIQATVKVFDNGDRLLEHCLQEHTDILLLDIMMPLLNGMDAAHERSATIKPDSITIRFTPDMPPRKKFPGNFFSFHLSLCQDTLPLCSVLFPFHHLP